MEDILLTLNESQKIACTTNEKHVLILAGAGTGKTRTLISRIIYLVKNKNINPFNILAVTFTNKACNEMKNRISRYFNNNIEITIRTFHSFGVYILRNEAFMSERNKYFQIYDTDDSKKAIIEVLKKFGINKSMADKIYRWIQNYKQNLEKDSMTNFQNEEYFNIYKEYNEFLKKSNSFDFEDLILEPIKIFKKFPEILKKYQNKFSYILVDEYQDTNHSQFELLKLLNTENNFLMVVGDEDQSIYKFRGADINNILNFEKDYSNVRIIRLEQNYRSTSNILNTANVLILNNNLRIGKTLYSQNEKGSKIKIFESANETEEALNVMDYINTNNFIYNETVILYRTNNQSRPFEQIFNKYKIPHRIIGSIRFFEREEIKDFLSILKWLINPGDRIAFERFVNKPARGIGEKALNLFYLEAVNYIDLFNALQNIERMKSLTAKQKETFLLLLEIFKDKDKFLNEKAVDKLGLYFFERLNLWEYYKNYDSTHDTDKINNLIEFLKSLEFKGKGIDVIVSVLEETSLTQPEDSIDENNNKIKLMTVHNAKGLEFENVFIAGAEENLFPHINSCDDESDFEEERRLFYVALTRAKKNIFISFCRERNIFGRFEQMNPSVFIEELPKDLLELNLLNKNVNSNIDFFQEGDIVKHKDYGKGKIIRIEKSSGKHLAKIDFWDYAFLELILEYTKLEKITD